VPQSRAGIGVVGVDAVVLGRDDQHVVDNAVHAERREIQRLGIDQPVRRQNEQLPESLVVHICESQLGFCGVESGTRIIVVVGKHVLAKKGTRQNEQ